MSASSTCPQCGRTLLADAPQGVCPDCLLRLLTEPAAGSVMTMGGLDGHVEANATESGTPQPFGDYELLEEIARGGMGVIYRARQKSLDRIVAVKVILAGRFAGKELTQRFRGEAAAAGTLQHPNIVAIHEVGMHQGQPFFSMDYIQGQNLAQFVKNTPLPASQAARYVKIIAEAIHYAHQRGILHRDLKPSNILIDANDQPRVTDFGLAKRLDGYSSLTVTGQVLGSPNFMPPEQTSETRGKVGRHSDVYGLGAILYYLLTARPPFQADSLEGIVTLTASADGEIKVWDLLKLRKGNVLLTNVHPSWGLAISPDERRLAAAHPQDGQYWIRVWDRFTGAVTHQISADGWMDGDLAFSPNGRLLSWATSRTLELYDFETGRTNTISIDRRESGFVPLAFSPNGQEIAVSSHRDVMLCGVDAAPPQRFISCRKEIDSIAYSPNGELLAVGLDDGTLTVWDRTTGLNLLDQPAHIALTARATFSPDGKWLASCGTLRIQLWRITSRGIEHFKKLEGHTGYVPSIAFSPDGKRLVSCSSDKTLKLWDTADGKEVGTLYGHFAWICDVEFSRDGNTIYSKGMDGTVRTWEAPPWTNLNKP